MARGVVEVGVRTLFGTWLTRTRDLQVRAYGTDPGALAGEELAEFLRWNTLAAHTELSEMLALLPWKPWSAIHRARAEGYRSSLAPDDGRQPKELAEAERRDDAVDELVDVLHFVANILAALNCSDMELNERYAAKMSINEERQRTGY